MPCRQKVFTLNQKQLQKSFIVNGHVVYRLVEPTKKEKRQLNRTGIKKTVILLGPVSKINSTKDLDRAITSLLSGV
jgi:hypothetical protein